MQLIMQLVLNRGDTFLVEAFAYSHLLEGVSEPHGYNPLPVPIDKDGIVPAGLRQVRCNSGFRAAGANEIVFDGLLSCTALPVQKGKNSPCQLVSDMSSCAIRGRLHMMP